MLTGKLPWSASSESDLLSKMLSTDPNMLLLRCGKDLVLIIKRCLHPDKDSRPSLEEIHRFIAAETKLQFKTGKSVSFRHTISHTVLQLERNKPTIFADEVNRSNRTDRANR